MGETVAALEARHAAEASPFPEVRRVLQLIARDEEKHAALAWRFVRWALQVGGTPVAKEVRRALSAALDAGAVGLSTGRTDNHRTAKGNKTPAAEVHEDELVSLARVFSDRKTGVLQAVSDFVQE